jgi:hypothetical protein
VPTAAEALVYPPPLEECEEDEKEEEEGATRLWLLPPPRLPLPLLLRWEWCAEDFPRLAREPGPVYTASAAPQINTRTTVTRAPMRAVQAGLGPPPPPSLESHAGLRGRRSSSTPVCVGKRGNASALMLDGDILFVKKEKFPFLFAAMACGRVARL